MNAFKERLHSGTPQLGLWQALASGYTAEICAMAGYDWLLFDLEHAPNTMQTMLAQIQAIAPYPAEPIVRVPSGEPVVIKQYLDLGFHAVMVPLVSDATHAQAMVEACRYPPHGIRGISLGTARGAHFGRREGYLASAHELVTLIVQIETAEALDNIEAIAAVDGVDVLFIGPNDLAASMGHTGDMSHPDVQQAITRIHQVARQAGKATGIFARSPQDVRDCAAAGMAMIALGTDIGLLLKGGAAQLEAARA